MNKVLVLLSLLFLSEFYFSQTIILKETVDENLEDKDYDFGPNRKIFDHPYFGYSWAVNGVSFQNENSLSKTRIVPSFGLYSGTRFYKNYNKILTRVFDAEISYTQYSLKLNEDSIVSIPVTTEDAMNAKYWFLKLGVSWGYNLNIQSKRGNHLGKYLYVGAFGNWLPVKRISAKYDLSNSQYAQTSRVGLGKLSFVDKWEYGPCVRVGASSWTLFANYRINNLFLNNTDQIQNYNELPRLRIGIHFFPGNV